MWARNAIPRYLTREIYIRAIWGYPTREILLISERSGYPTREILLISERSGFTLRRAGNANQFFEISIS
jgi:hypothetical protein